MAKPLTSDSAARASGPRLFSTRIELRAFNEGTNVVVYGHSVCHRSSTDSFKKAQLKGRELKDTCTIYLWERFVVARNGGFDGDTLNVR